MIDGLGKGVPIRLPTRDADNVRTAAAATGKPPGAAARHVTSGGGQLVREMAATPPVDSARVAALRSAIAAGSYRPDPDAIAGRMIALERGTGIA